MILNGHLLLFVSEARGCAALPWQTGHTEDNLVLFSEVFIIAVGFLGDLEIAIDIHLGFTTSYNEMRHC